MTQDEAAAALRGEIKGRKAAIRRERALLAQAAARLRQLECRRLGIGYVNHRKGEGGGTHGRDDTAAP